MKTPRSITCPDCGDRYIPELTGNACPNEYNHWTALRVQKRLEEWRRQSANRPRLHY